MDVLIAAFVASLIALASGIAQSKYGWFKQFGIIVFALELFFLIWVFYLFGLLTLKGLSDPSRLNPYGVRLYTATFILIVGGIFANLILMFIGYLTKQ